MRKRLLSICQSTLRKPFRAWIKMALKKVLSFFIKLGGSTNWHTRYKGYFVVSQTATGGCLQRVQIACLPIVTNRQNAMLYYSTLWEDYLCAFAALITNRPDMMHDFIMKRHTVSRAGEWFLRTLPKFSRALIVNRVLWQPIYTRSIAN